MLRFLKAGAFLLSFAALPAAVLGQGASWAAAAAASAQPERPMPEGREQVPFNNNKTPLSEPEFLLISRHGYRVQSDGTFREPGTARAVGRYEMNLLLDE